MIDVPIQVKDALREGRLRKNYRFQVLNDDGTVDFTIDNNNLVSESVSIDERMCSGDTIKYGLCEGSSIEFQYFGKENITGRQLKVFVDVEYEDELAYTYTDVEEFPRFDPVTITTPGHYKVYSAVEGVSFEVYLTRGAKTKSFESIATEDGAEIVLGELKSGDSLELTWGSMFWTAPMLQVGTAVPYTIPMGYFTVKNCSRQASTGIIKAVCYNKLQSDYLDAKANNLLIDSYDNPNQLVTIFDVRNTLLNDYEIQEKEKTKIEIARDYSEDNIFRKLSGGAITFKAKYGIDSPLNFYTYAGAETSTSTTVYPFITSFASGTTLDATKVYHVKFPYNMEALEQSYYDEISRLMILSFNVTEDYMDRFMVYQPGSSGHYAEFLGWHQFMGVKLTFSDNSVKWYSTIAYNNGLSGVVGTFKDLEQITILNCIKIDFLIPSNLIFYSSANSEGGYALKLALYDNRYWDYEYWLNSNFVRTGQGSYVLYGPDGPVTYQWLRTGWAELYEYTNMSDADKIHINPIDLSDFTLREITSASYETVCQFGQLDRETDLFSGVELNRSRLLPADTLYPDNALYPDGAQESAFRSQYSKLWADEGNVHKWRYLIITYKGLDGEGNEQDYTLQRTVNADGTDDYNCSDNWLFRNLVWTAEQIEEYAEAMKAKMQSITWFPFEMWCAGLPYLETGDEIEIPLGNQTYTSYILQRQLKGIQNLQDTYINGTLDIF